MSLADIDITIKLDGLSTEILPQKETSYKEGPQINVDKIRI